MEYNSSTVSHSEDCEKPRIKKEFLSQDEITESQTIRVQQINTHFIKFMQSSDVDTKSGIKQETWDPDVASSDIKWDTNQASTCLGTGTIKDDKIDIEEHNIQEELPLQNKTHETHIVANNENIDVKIITGIKQETWDPNGVSSDIKCDTEQLFTLELEPFLGTLKAADEMDIKEELCWVEGTLTDSRNEGEGSGSRKNEAAEDELLMKSRLNAHASKFNCQRSVFTTTFPNNRNNYCLTSNSFHKKHNTLKRDKHHKYSVCDLSCSQLKNLKRHKLIHEGKMPHKCNVCDKTFTLPGDFNRHKLIHKGEKLHKCNVCDKSFTRPGILRAHKFIHGGKKPHKCNVCDKSFAMPGTLKIHTLIHEGQKPHKCNVCNKSFTRLGTLKVHKMIHEGKKPHKCNVCDKSFTLSGNLNKHKMIHEGKKPHKCNVCDKSFTLTGDLNKHKLIHAGKKPHKCDVCDKSFTLLGNLNKHKLIHEGKMPFKCDVCNKSFTLPGTLKLHKLVHECKKPHQCNVCSKSFTRLGTLKVHKLIHAGKKPHNCNVCDKSFTQLGSLKRHKLIHEHNKH